MKFSDKLWLLMNPKKPRGSSLSNTEQDMVRSLGERGEMRVGKMGSEAVANAQHLESLGWVKISNNGIVSLTKDGEDLANFLLKS